MDFCEVRWQCFVGGFENLTVRCSGFSLNHLNWKNTRAIGTDLRLVLAVFSELVACEVGDLVVWL